VFVDLFVPTRALYAAAKTPLTQNGVHMTAEGNRQLAELIDSTLFGPAGRRTESLPPRLRQAVVDKSWHWFQRYRVTDGYSTYGERAFLNFVRGTPANVNADVAAKAPKEHVSRKT